MAAPICRACTNECSDYKLLHSVGLILGRLTTLATMLSFCTDMSFPEEEHHLPEQICISCVQKLAKSFLFKQMVIDADEVLRKAVSVNEEIIDELETDELEQNKYINVDVENVDDIQSIVGPDSKVVIEEECVIEEYEIASQETESDEPIESIADSNIHEAIVDYGFENVKVGDIDCIEEEIDELENYNDCNIGEIEEEVEETLLDDELSEEPVSKEEEFAGFSDVDENESDNSQLETCEQNDDNMLNQNSTDDTTDPNMQIQCSVCQKLLKNRKSYNLHIKRHDPYNPKACEYCGKVYRQLETLQRHLLSHTGEKPIQCQVCGRGFRFQSNFIAHMRQHTGERPFKCSYCNTSFGTRKHMKRHELVHLSSDNSFPCDICGKAFSQARYLDMHKLRHAGGKPYQCHLCGKSVAQQGYLKRHMLTHTGEKPFQCDMCEKNFRDAKTLKIHKLHHAGIKPYECPYCEKNFSTSRQLKIHIMIHTGETPFACDICGKSYRVSRSLQRHMLVHTGERNHICEVCGFKFRFESNLIAHRRLHTRDDAKCPYCKKAFRTEKQLDRHIQRYHGSKVQATKNDDKVAPPPPSVSTKMTARQKQNTIQPEMVNQKLSKSNLVELL